MWGRFRLFRFNLLVRERFPGLKLDAAFGGSGSEDPRTQRNDPAEANWPLYSAAMRAQRSRAVRVGTWNTEWAAPKSARANRIRPILDAPKCHVLCVTEGYEELLPSGGHVIDGGEDWGYPIVPGRREVLLWSERPWRRVEQGLASMSGRFVAGVTETPIGDLRIAGVCIPWFDAHVRTGRRNRKRWDVHLEWLEGFETLSCATGARTIVLGDFNQRVPHSWVPHHVYASLLRAFEGLQIATIGFLPWENQDDRAAGVPQADLWHAPLGDGPKSRDQLIDHIAYSRDLAIVGPEEAFGIFPKRTPYKVLSDHIGVWKDFRLAAGA